MVFAAAELLVCVLLLRIGNGSWASVLRAGRLLLWFILPIFLLHLLFTPGALIWPGSSAPFTWEGWHRGAWLSLHLLLLFYAAMLLSRALSLEEWQAWLCRIPWLGRRLYPYLLLFGPMRDEAVRLVRNCWRFRKYGLSFRVLSDMLGALLEDILGMGRSQAETVWKNWNGMLPATDSGLDRVALMLLVCGSILPWLAWRI